MKRGIFLVLTGVLCVIGTAEAKKPARTNAHAAGSAAGCPSKAIDGPKTVQGIYLGRRGDEEGVCVEFRLADGKTECFETTDPDAVDRLFKKGKSKKASVTIQTEQYWFEPAAECVRVSKIRYINRL